MILVTGINGQLGFDVVRELTKRNVEVVGTTRREIDLTNGQNIKKFILEKNPKAVIHCAAYTAVDKAEIESELAIKINGYATRYIAEACRELDSKMIYISTDYVFNGAGEQPYEIYDNQEPINAYGLSKFLGEKAVIEILKKYFIVRISWVFGINGKNFFRTMLRLSEKHKKLQIVNDQIGSPTYTVDLAKLLADMVVTENYGIYHATNENFCSWADFAIEIFKQANADIVVEGIPTSKYPTPARRPLNSRLSKKSLDMAGFKRLPVWQDAIKRFFLELKEKRIDILSN